MKPGLVPEVTAAIRDDTPIGDAKLATLAEFTRSLFHPRGLPAKSAVEAFPGAGYSERQILEIALALAVNNLSNYANHLFHTPSGHAWTQE